MVANILAGLEKRRLSLRLNDTGDGLKLKGPQSAITPKIIATLKDEKPALVAYLREREERGNTSFPLPEIIYHDDPTAFWREYKRQDTPGS